MPYRRLRKAIYKTVLRRPRGRAHHKKVGAKQRPVKAVKPKQWYPKGVRSKKERELYDKLKLRSVGSWSHSYLENTDYAKVLAERHWSYVKKALAKAKAPKNQKEAEELYRKAMMSPEQRFIILYEVSLTRPLSPSEFQEYMELFKQVAGEKVYRSLFGDRSPARLTQEATKQEKDLIRKRVIAPESTFTATRR